MTNRTHQTQGLSRADIKNTTTFANKTRQSQGLISARVNKAVRHPRRHRVSKMNKTSRGCVEDDAFRDSFGYSCKDWAVFGCNSDMSTSEEDTQAVMDSCPVACGLCGPRPPFAKVQASTSLSNRTLAAKANNAKRMHVRSNANASKTPTFLLRKGIVTANMTQKVQGLINATVHKVLPVNVNKTPKTQGLISARVNRTGRHPRRHHAGKTKKKGHGCVESSTFRDSFGYSCKDWAGFGCNSDMFTSEEQSAAVKENCPVACGFCGHRPPDVEVQAPVVVSTPALDNNASEPVSEEELAYIGMEAVLGNHTESASSSPHAASWTAMLSSLRLAVKDARVRTICESGLGKGHTATVELFDSLAQVHIFDLGAANENSRPVALWLSKRYGPRLNVHWGDSRLTLPSFASTGRGARCNVIVIDGGSEYDVVASDLANFQELADPAYNVVLINGVNCHDRMRCEGPTRAWREVVQAGLATESVAQTEHGGSNGFALGRFIRVPPLTAASSGYRRSAV